MKYLLVLLILMSCGNQETPIESTTLPDSNWVKIGDSFTAGDGYYKKVIIQGDSIYVEKAAIPSGYYSDGETGIWIIPQRDTIYIKADESKQNGRWRKKYDEIRRHMDIRDSYSKKRIELIRKLDYRISPENQAIIDSLHNKFMEEAVYVNLLWSEIRKL